MNKEIKKTILTGLLALTMVANQSGCTKSDVNSLNGTNTSIEEYTDLNTNDLPTIIRNNMYTLDNHIYSYDVEVSDAHLNSDGSFSAPNGGTLINDKVYNLTNFREYTKVVDDASVKVDESGNTVSYALYGRRLEGSKVIKEEYKAVTDPEIINLIYNDFIALIKQITSQNEHTNKLVK